MGIVDIDHFDLMATNIPFFPVNYDLMNICYLIIYTPGDVKMSHMSIIIDLGGNSTQTHIIGLMVHLIANLDDGLCPHSTTIKKRHLADGLKYPGQVVRPGDPIVFDQIRPGFHRVPSNFGPDSDRKEYDKNRVGSDRNIQIRSPLYDLGSVDAIVLGKLEQSKYLNNNNLPAYFLNYIVSIATYFLIYLKKRHIYILDSGGYTWINSNSTNGYSFKTAFAVLIGKVYFYFFSFIDFLYL
jgi:hypothetical protein